MASVSVRLAESAVADLEELRAWYTEQGVPTVGDRFVEEILDRIEALSDHPGMGRIVREFDQPLLRELIQPPFRVVYRQDPGRVSVVRIWRSERLPVLPPEGGG